MQDFLDAFVLAFDLVFSGNKDLIEIVMLSLRVSLTAVAFAIIIGLPLGAALATFRFYGRSLVVVLLNALMGLPPVVVGLIVYLQLSRAGPMGSFGLLYTPTAMIIAQVILILPQHFSYSYHKFINLFIIIINFIKFLSYFFNHNNCNIIIRYPSF